MSEELQRPNSPNPEAEALKAENEALRKHNDKLLSDYKTARETAKALPQGVDVN